jgi:hypothetical protein
MMGNAAYSSTRQCVVRAGVAFCLVLGVGLVSDFVVPPHSPWMIADDLILGLAAAMMVFAYEKERSRFLSNRLRVIQEMNSYVRNELQVLYACLEHPEQTRVPTIERCVERIDWALRELLPGGRSLSDAPTEKLLDRRRDNIERSA